MSDSDNKERENYKGYEECLKVSKTDDYRSIIRESSKNHYFDIMEYIIKETDYEPHDNFITEMENGCEMFIITYLNCKSDYEFNDDSKPIIIKNKMTDLLLWFIDNLKPIKKEVLDAACLYGDIEVVNILLDYCVKSENAMENACLSSGVNSVKIVNILLDANDKCEDYEGKVFTVNEKCICNAIESHNFELFEILFNRDVDGEYDYREPLYVSIRTGNYEVYDFLKEYGVYTTRPDLYSSTSDEMTQYLKGRGEIITKDEIMKQMTKNNLPNVKKIVSLGYNIPRDFIDRISQKKNRDYSEMISYCNDHLE